MVEQFKSGDVVFLNSGSPRLSVETQDARGWVRVQWFDGAQQFRDAFPEDCLVKTFPASAPWEPTPYLSEMSEVDEPFPEAETMGRA